MHPKEDWITSKAQIRYSTLQGRGLFAVAPISAGEDVMVWGGRYVNAEEAAKAQEQGKIVMQFDDDAFTVEDRGELETYFINHSCDPNVWMKNAFTLQAKKNISPGDELTADYVMWEADENYVSGWKCQCGSPHCRERLTGKDWMRPDLQERYKDHFIPMINRRIQKLQR